MLVHVLVVKRNSTNLVESELIIIWWGHLLINVVNWLNCLPLWLWLMADDWSCELHLWGLQHVALLLHESTTHVIVLLLESL